MKDYKPWETWFIHVLTVLSFAIVGLSVIYYVYRITLPIVLSVLVLSAVLGYVFRPHVSKTRKTSKSKKFEGSFVLALISIIANIAILFVLFLVRTDAGIASPWQVVPGSLFILYGVSSFFLIFALKHAPKRFSLPALYLHALVTWSVSLIIYRLGFGYDPFVHQATERHILEHGMIHPKQPFYIGQYVSVVSLSLLTRLPTAFLDRILLPLSVVATIPTIFYISLRHGWMKRFSKLPVALMAIFLVPISYFAFTAPFNLSLVSLIAVIVLIPLTHETRIRWLVIAIALCSFVTHPLIGIPTVVIAAAALIQERRYAAWLSFILVPAGLMGAFFTYAWMQGAILPWPTFADFENALFALFGNPYELWLGSAALAGYYSFLYISPILLIGLGSYGYIQLHKRNQELRDSIRLLTWTALGFIASAVLIPTFFYFPNIISIEQFEFSLRLLAILPVLFLPGMAYAVHHLFIRVKFSFPRTLLVTALASLVLMGVWYATYPQYNAISYFPAPGMSRADLEAVRFVEADAKGEPYTVLSHQMMSAAALQEYGFDRGVPTVVGERYFYAIPTGGELYELYLRLLSEGDNPLVAYEDLTSFIQSDNIYVAIPFSWDPFGEVDMRLQPFTSSTHRVLDINIYKLKTATRE